MDVLKPTLSTVKRNVAKKSTSNRPLKKTRFKFNYEADKVSCQRLKIRNDCIEFVKCIEIDSGNADAFINSGSDKELSHASIPNNSYTTILSKEDTINLYSEEEEDSDIEGVFEVPEYFESYLHEAMVSPVCSEDSSDDTLDYSNILNFPQNLLHLATSSNSLYIDNCLDRPGSDKSEMIKGNVSTKLFNDGVKCELLYNDQALCDTECGDTVGNEIFDKSPNSNFDAPVDENENGYDGCNLKIEFICSIENSENFALADENQNGLTVINELPKQDIEISPPPPKQSVAGKKNNKKRKIKSKLYFGQRSKRKTRSCKDKFSTDSGSYSEEINSSEESIVNLVGNTTKNCELLTQHTFNDDNSNSNNFLEQGADKITAITDEPVPQELKLNSKESLSGNEHEIPSVISDSIKSIGNQNMAIESEDSGKNNDPQVTELEPKKKNGPGDKKCKKEINEGVLLHVEAVKETDIMRDGKLLKDKKELLKDIESKIENNLPVEVKEFDIQQSLTEEILLEQALRLAHQRTSPRRRPLLTNSQAKAILNSLTNPNKYKTRSGEKKSVHDNDSPLIEEGQKQLELDVSDSQISDSSSIDHSDLRYNKHISSLVTSLGEKTNIKQKKKSAKKVSRTTRSQRNNLEKVNVNTESKTFTDVNEDSDDTNSSDENRHLDKNEEYKQKTKRSNRKRKTNKKSKKNSFSGTKELLQTVEKADDLSILENEEYENKRVPVLIIKNKKVTLADRKNYRPTNCLFSIIKNTEHSNPDSKLKDPEVKKLEGACTKPTELSDTPEAHSPRLPTDTSNEDTKEQPVEFQKPLTDIEPDTCITSEVNTCSYKSNEGIGQNCVSNSLHQASNNPAIKNLDDLLNEDVNTIAPASPPKQLLNEDMATASPKSEINKTQILDSDEIPISKSKSEQPMSEDIVEVIDMVIAEADSPVKANHNKELDKDTIPFFENSDQSEINKSNEKPPYLLNTIGFPIPTIADLKNTCVPSLGGISNPCYSSPTSSVNDSTRLPAPPTSVSNLPSSFTCPPPPFAIHNPVFSTSLNSANAPAFSVSPSTPMTTMISTSVPPPSSSYYSPYSTPVSSQPLNDTSNTHFINNCSLRQPPLSGLPLQASLHSPPNMYPFPAASTPGIPPVALLTSLAHSSAVQNPIISTSETPPPYMKNSLHYPEYLYQNNQDYRGRCPYPLPTKETPQLVPGLSAKTSDVTKESQFNNADSTTPQLMTRNDSSVEQPKSSFPAPPEPERTTSVPLSIAVRDPRLRGRSIQVSRNALSIKINAVVDKNESPTSGITQNLSEKTKENPEEECIVGEKSVGDMEKTVSEEVHMETDNKECDDINNSPKKKPKKKEIDLELLYKTPLSDLHDAPERTSSYTRTVPRQPGRMENKRDPRCFRRDVNSEPNCDQEVYQEPQAEYSHPENYNHDYSMMPEPHRTEGYDYRNEEHTYDVRIPDLYSKRRPEDIPEDPKRSKEYPERRPFLEHPSDFRRYRQRENYTEPHMRSYSPDFRQGRGPDYRRKNPEDPAYPRWDYAHKRVDGIFPPEDQESEKTYGSKHSEDLVRKKSWEDENEIRDLIDGPIASASRPFYRRKRFSSKQWKPSHLRGQEGSSSPFEEDLFERRRDFNRGRPWDRKWDEANGFHGRDGWEDRRYQKGRSRSPRRDYEMYEKKRDRSPRRRERSRTRWGSVSPKHSPYDLESPMSPEPEKIPYADPLKYLGIPQ